MEKLFPKKSRKPLRAIKLQCFECMGWDRRSKPDSEKPIADVKGCTDPDCPLFEFRTGRNPFLKGGKGNPEALKKARKALKLS